MHLIGLLAQVLRQSLTTGIKSQSLGRDNKNSQKLIRLGFHQLGEVFDFSTCLKLPPDRSPNVSWVQLQRWNALNTEQREKFPPIAPNFVLELIPSDSLSEMQAKMGEYTDAKVRLG